MEMRKVFSGYLKEAMATDERICVLDADLANANGTLELRKLYPERAFDVGIAEQNMASVAAGLSSYGFVPFITSFACFASRRICDQVALSCAYAKQNVKIVGTDPGVTAEINGGTHMAIEDIAVLRSIPGIVIFEPCDEQELLQSMPQLIDYNGTVYIRLNRKAAPDLHDSRYKFDLFKADILQSGCDVTLYASGAVMTSNAMEAGKLLAQEGIKAEVINVHTIKPIDKETVVASAKKTGAAVTCENHSVIGGLYSAVCETLAAEYPITVVPIGFKDVCGEVGKADELVEKHGMTPKDIAAAAKLAISKKA